MADVNIEQIITTLKQRFTEQHQFIFWFDETGDFTDSITEIRSALADIAEVVVMAPGQQLATKHYLLSLPPQTKALVYSPTVEPTLEEDHLRNIVLYSGTFTADSKEILRKDLGLPVTFKPFIKQYASFFASSQRRKVFARYNVASYTVKPELAIMAALVPLNQPNVDFFDLLQTLLLKGVQDNSVLALFERFGVLRAFWQEVADRFGYIATDPRLDELVADLYVTMTYQQMEKTVPVAAKQYDLSDHAANVQTFIQQFGNRNNMSKSEANFDSIAMLVWQKVNGDRLFRDTKMDDIAKSDMFPRFDQRILLWIQERLRLEDVDSRLNDLTVVEITRSRLNTHFGSQLRFSRLYRMMRHAWNIVRHAHWQANNKFPEMIDDYVTKDYRLDTSYRKFTYYYQQAGLPEDFGQAKELIESIYVNNYLDRSIYAWNEQLDIKKIEPHHLQRDFYRFHVAPEKNRVVVIISDAFRFEAAKELEKRLSREDQITSLTMDYLVTGLPSVTYMGMSMLLPNHQMSLENKELLVDDQPTANRQQRQMILQNRNSESAAYSLDELKGAASKDIRAKFIGKEVVYIYHNQIDAIGDNKKTEDDVFKATTEAINEIQQLISRLRTQGISNIYVTADHGYIYRDDHLKPTDKIDVATTETDVKSQRYLITSRKFTLPGVTSQRLGDILVNDDSRYVYYPKTANVFKSAGSFNYVHGGSSLQEMLVPLLEVKTTSSRSVARDVTLELFSMNRQITSLTVPLVLRQSLPISSTVIPAEFNLYFVDEQGQQISGQQTVNANSRSADVKERMQQVQLVLADHNYDRTKTYRLIIENLTSGEKTEVPFGMDIANLNDFNF
ncbi:BREX-1 system phosphatase PglZ type A [Lactiplantibacillus dongliensis]|uniref:BREX-1 system phosphatase PglZ type A n=1 Tax=Lactiplantibacillus dongliensis TaxID=2559919 RepID=A0ABW1R604_9LACO|nr:BREX-1 system phosphatase PglZ type A [Lactiplantibacillus dongliensis]